MKIAIFGASGATGQLLTERSLAAGHTVAALLRTPASFPYADRVQVVAGDAFSSADVAQTVRGTDAVFSALGARSLKREDVLERAVPLIIRAMQAEHVSRIIVLGGASALSSSLRKQPLAIRWLLEHFLYNGLLKWPSTSQRAQYAALSTSPLDWTMVMPPMLTNAAGRGQYRIDGEALPRGGRHIARADVADFMFRQLRSNEWSRKGVYISW
jgi:putative NADH-flavin reductase